MDFKRILRGPWLWILVAVGVLVRTLSFLTQGGYKPISTQDGLALLAGGNVGVGEDRRHRAAGRPHAEEGRRRQGGTLVQFYYVAPRPPRWSRRSTTRT